jgi:hypothetical protein
MYKVMILHSFETRGCYHFVVKEKFSVSEMTVANHKTRQPMKEDQNILVIFTFRPHFFPHNFVASVNKGATLYGITSNKV